MTKACCFLNLLIICLSGACAGEHYSDAPLAEVTEAMPVPSVSKGDTVQLNTETSSIAWEGTKMWGRGMHSGTVDILKGYLVINNDRAVGGRITADMTEIGITDIPPDQPEPIKLLTSHLENEVFFNVETYPTANFAFTDIRYLPGSRIQVHGNLTIRGITKNIMVLGAFEPSGPETTYSTRFRIDRFKWDIAYTGGFGKTFFSARNFVDRYIEIHITIAVPAGSYGPSPTNFVERKAG